METFINNHVVPIAKNLLFAIIIFVAGMAVIRIVNKYLPKSKFFIQLDASVSSFIMSTIKILLYILLLVTIISVLGVPMASIIAALTSAFLAIGLALQGALSNFAGGIMILVFRPFKVGDYITCAGGPGTVKEISVIYTSVITDDNNRITVPNGTLMNDSVINHTVEEERRVDIKFSVAYGTNESKVKDKLFSRVMEDARILTVPSADFKTIAYLDNGIQYSLRIWCDASVYWSVYYDYMEYVKTVLAELNVSAPTSNISFDVNK